MIKLPDKVPMRTPWRDHFWTVDCFLTKCGESLVIQPVVRKVEDGECRELPDHEVAQLLASTEDVQAFEEYCCQQVRHRIFPDPGAIPIERPQP